MIDDQKPEILYADLLIEIKKEISAAESILKQVDRGQPQALVHLMQAHRVLLQVINSATPGTFSLEPPTQSECWKMLGALKKTTEKVEVFLYKENRLRPPNKAYSFWKVKIKTHLVFLSSVITFLVFVFLSKNILVKSLPPAMNDFEFIKSQQDWGDLQVDKSVIGRPLTLQGVVYPHGYGTHARSSIFIRLNPQSKMFFGKCGLDDETEHKGSVQCSIYSNGIKLFQSGTINGGDKPASFSLPVIGLNPIELRVEPTTFSNDFAHTDWVDLHVTF